MPTIRVKFSKGEEVKYISHLDLMRTIYRVIRRSGVPVSYSHGFNPHQEISFGAPLPLGVTSEAEYADICVENDIEPTELIRLFNSEAPRGIMMYSGVVLTPGTKSAMALVTHSEYRLSIVIPYADLGVKNTEEVLSFLSHKLEDFSGQNEIFVTKHNKKTKQDKIVDVKPLLIKSRFEILNKKDEELLGDAEHAAISMILLVKSGSTDNIKPEIVVDAFSQYINTKIDIRRIHRIELFKYSEKGLTDLFGNEYINI